MNKETLERVQSILKRYSVSNSDINYILNLIHALNFKLEQKTTAITEVIKVIQEKKKECDIYGGANLNINEIEYILLQSYKNKKIEVTYER